MKEIFKGKIILITGGCGSIGSEIVRQVLSFEPKQVRILDNRETELFHLQHELSEFSNVRMLLGDIREKERLVMAMEDVDIVFHAAALKHVHYCEYNPFEATKTNVYGTQNVIEACLQAGVEKMINISTDKVTNAINTLGATKLLAERLVSATQYYKGNKKTLFCSVRFGNVVGSRGSVIDLFKKQIERKQRITVTDPEMTRFIMSIPDAVSLVLKAATYTQGGEVFVLKMPVFKLDDLANAVIEHHAEEEAEMKIIGLRTGEKMFEELMTTEESRNTLETDDLLIIRTNVDIPNFVEKEHNYPGAIQTKKKKLSSHEEEKFSKDELKKYLINEGIL